MPAPRPARRLLAAFLAIAVAALTGCTAVTPRTVKIGLVAPFEGDQRDIGSDVIPAVRLAIREYAGQVAAAGDRGRVAVELVAYDDLGDPVLAVVQAEKLIADPDVKAVIGHWTDEATAAAAPVYAEAGIPLVAFSPADLPAGARNLSPSEAELAVAAQTWAETADRPVRLFIDAPPEAYTSEATPQAGADALPIGGPAWGSGQAYALYPDALDGAAFVTGAAARDALPTLGLPAATTDGFAAGYEAGSLGASPGLLAWSAYEAAWVAIELATGDASSAPGADAPTFGADGRRTDAPIFLYRWADGERQLVERLR